MSTLQPTEKPARTTRLLNIARIWTNEPRGDNSPVMSGRIDRDLGASITLSPNDRLVFFPNSQREGKKDADFRVAIELPAEVVDRMIKARQSTPDSLPTPL